MLRNERPSEPAHEDEAAGDTRSRILDAAFGFLATRGYHALTSREVARAAGVNHALINYYFGSKDRLVIAVLDEANRRLLARQRGMYAAPGGFAEKWAEARRFYEDDLASGFVRVQAELYAASLADEGLREQFLPRIRAWKDVVQAAVVDALALYRPALPPPFSAEAIACLICEFWLGMEFARLLGGEQERARHEAALDAMASVIATLDAAAAPPSPAASRKGAAASTPAPTRRAPRARKETSA